MNIRFRYDLEKKIFVNASGVGVAGKIKPEIAYGMKPVWEWEFINSAGEPWDISNVAAWRAAIDTDFRDETAPMCRTLGGITVVNNVVHCPMDALTTTYRDKANGRDVTNGFFDLTGFDAAGVKIFYFRCPVACLYVLDPEEVVDPLDPPETTVDAAQVEAIAQGVVNAALAAYTPPDGEPGPIGPAPRFEFSATGIVGTWHATWAPGDLYLRVSTDLGVTWQGPVPLGTQNATFPLVPVWSDEVTYATGALVAYGTPAGLYQAKEPVGYDQSPEDVPAKWQQVAGPGADGASSMWLMGSGAPTAEIGNEHDQYLDELYNHYRKVDGAWVQMGSIKGANGAGINHRGAWSAAAAYSVGDGVTSNGSVWSCTVPHTGQEPPATPEGLSLYWELFLARGTTGNPGPAGTVQIVAVNMLAPTADPYASEGAGSTAARRLYTLNLPRGSTGPAGSLRIEMGLALEPDEDPVIQELPGSTPHNRSYRVRLPMGQPGERGTGMNFNATGTLAGRVAYDGADGGFCYLATDILTDDLDHHYQAMYYKVSDAIGDWSDAIRLYAGQPGQEGKPGPPGIQGPPGENAAVKPAQEFIADDLYERTLIVSGTDPIATVEVYDVSGHAHALALGTAAGEIAITTRADVGQTLVTFGPGVDLTYGGRIRFAQGLLAADGGSVGPALSDDAPVALADAATAGSSGDAARADHAHPTTGLVLASEKGAASGVATLGADGKVPASMLPTIPAPGPALSNAAAAVLADTAAAGASGEAARADHVHPNTGLVKSSAIGAVNGVAGLGADGKVPTAQLPESSGGGATLSNATPAALGEASPGVSGEASRADHVHPVPTSAFSPASQELAAAWSGNIYYKRNFYDVEDEIWLTFPVPVGGYAANTPVRFGWAMIAYEWEGYKPSTWAASTPALVPYEFSFNVGNLFAYPPRPIPTGVPIIMQLNMNDALDLAFDRWQRSQFSGYPSINFLTKEVYHPTGGGLADYLWASAHPTASQCEYSYYRPVDTVTPRRLRMLYQASGLFPGWGGEPYRKYAEAYIKYGVLASTSGKVFDDSMLSRTDGTGYVWPDCDYPDAPRPRHLFYNPIQTSTSGGYYDPHGLLYPMAAWGMWFLHPDNLTYDGRAGFTSSYLRTLDNGEETVEQQTVFDGVPASFSDTTRAAELIPEYSALVNQGFVTTTMFRYNSHFVTGRWPSFLPLLFPDGSAEWLDKLGRAYEIKTASRLGKVLRFTPPDGAAYLEVVQEIVDPDTASYGVVNGVPTAYAKWIPSVYCRDTATDPIMPELLSYVDADGNRTYRERARRIFMRTELLRPYVHHVKYRWWYDNDNCTEWLTTPVEAHDVDNDHADLEELSPYDYYY